MSTERQAKAYSQLVTVDGKTCMSSCPSLPEIQEEMSLPLAPSAQHQRDHPTEPNHRCVMKSNSAVELMEFCRKLTATVKLP